MPTWNCFWEHSDHGKPDNASTVCVNEAKPCSPCLLTRNHTCIKGRQMILAVCWQLLTTLIVNFAEQSVATHTADTTVWASHGKSAELKSRLVAWKQWGSELIGCDNRSRCCCSLSDARSKLLFANNQLDLFHN